MTKYDEIMEKINLSPEARDRIIDNVTEELSSDRGYVPVKVRKTVSRTWKKYITAAACCILVAAGAMAAARSDVFINLMGGGSSDRAGETEFSNELSLGNDSGSSDSKSAAAAEEAAEPSESDETEATDEQDAVMAFETIADNEKDLSYSLGFDMNCAPIQELSEKAGMTEVSYKILGDGIGEISFSDGEHSNYFRKAAGTEDISGDYNLYDVEMEFDGSDSSGTLKGEMNDFKLAVWTTKEGFTYAAYIEEGLTDSEWQKIIDSIK